jgi:hypothetical protein
VPADIWYAKHYLDLVWTNLLYSIAFHQCLRRALRYQSLFEPVTSWFADYIHKYWYSNAWHILLYDGYPSKWAMTGKSIDLALKTLHTLQVMAFYRRVRRNMNYVYTVVKLWLSRNMMGYWSSILTSTIGLYF